MEASIELVSPEMAARWLTRNHSNREVDTGAVRRYSEAMLSGRWRLSGESLKFKVGGEVLDGQHRLMAVVRSGCTVPMLVLTDVEHWVVWHPGGTHHLNSEWCYTCDLERALARVLPPGGSDA